MNPHQKRVDACEQPLKKASYSINGGVRLTVTRVLAIGTLMVGCVFCQPLSTKVRQEPESASLPANARHVPAEWERHESIWMAWPTYNNKHDWDAETAYVDIVKALLSNVRLDLCVADAQTEAKVRRTLIQSGVSADVLTKQLRFHQINYGDIWLRDSGPIFVRNDSTLQAVDFNFNGWGWGPFVNDSSFADLMRLEESVDRQIASGQRVKIIKSPLILEGGGLEFNGEGTVLVSEDVVFQRNPTWTKPAVETEFARLFNTKKVIWLKGYVGNDAHPVINAPYFVSTPKTVELVYTLMTTNGHTDEFVRFINSYTVLLAEPPSADEAKRDPIAARTRQTLLQTKAILSASTDQDGNPIQIRFMPETQSIFVQLNHQDEIVKLMADLDFGRVSKQNIDPTRPLKAVLASSYLNYLVTNNTVLVAKYGDLHPGMAAKDAEAVRILQDAFQGRTIIPIDVRAINVGGGGIHCLTQQMPLVGRP